MRTPDEHLIRVAEAIAEIGSVDGTAMIEGLRAWGYRIVPADWWDACPTCDSIVHAEHNCLFCELPHPTPSTEPTACTDNWHNPQ